MHRPAQLRGDAGGSTVAGASGQELDLLRAKEPLDFPLGGLHQRCKAWALAIENESDTRRMTMTLSLERRRDRAHDSNAQGSYPGSLTVDAEACRLTAPPPFVAHATT